MSADNSSSESRSGKSYKWTPSAPSSISIDPKLAAEQLAGTGSVKRAFDMDDLGFNYLNVSLGMASRNQSGSNTRKSGVGNDSSAAKHPTINSNDLSGRRFASRPDDLMSRYTPTDGSGHHHSTVKVSCFPTHNRAVRSSAANPAPSPTRHDFDKRAPAPEPSVSTQGLRYSPQPLNVQQNATPVVTYTSQESSTNTASTDSRPIRMYPTQGHTDAASHQQRLGSEKTSNSRVGEVALGATLKRGGSNTHVSTTPSVGKKKTVPADGAFIDWAKMQPTQEVVRRMEQQGIKADTGTNKAGNTLMHGACETGNLSLVFLLYELYPATQLSVTNNSGLLPVHIACQKGMIHIVKFILDNKHADASVTTRDGRTCLHLAAQNNHIELVTYLVEVMPHEALWKTESCGLSALHVACMENHMEVVKALTRAPGADLSLPDSRGRTSLDIACILGHLSLVKVILSLPNDLRPDLRTRSGNNGYTCLHWACANHQYAVIKHLVQEEHMSITLRDKNNLTPDQLVDDAVVSLILSEYGCEGDEDDEEEEGSVYDSVCEEDVDDEGEEYEDEDDDDEDDEEDSEEESESVASTNKSEELVEKGSRKPKGTKSDRINDSGRSSSPNMQEGVDSALFVLVMDESNLPELEECLGVAPHIKRDVRSIKEEGTGDSLLHAACRCKYLATVQFLVEGVGSDVNSVNNEGKTCLHCAIASDHVSIVRYLVKFCGAALDIKDRSGKTAIDLCNELPNNSNSEEIKRIVTKGSQKSVTKRTKVSIPNFSA